MDWTCAEKASFWETFFFEQSQLLVLLYSLTISKFPQFCRSFWGDFLSFFCLTLKVVGNGVSPCFHIKMENSSNFLGFSQFDQVFPELFLAKFSMRQSSPPLAPASLFNVSKHPLQMLCCSLYCILSPTVAHICETNHFK